VVSPAPPAAAASAPRCPCAYVCSSEVEASAVGGLSRDEVAVVAVKCAQCAAAETAGSGGGGGQSEHADIDLRAEEREHHRGAREHTRSRHCAARTRCWASALGGSTCCTVVCCGQRARTGAANAPSCVGGVGALAWAGFLLLAEVVSGLGEGSALNKVVDG
jgi:hypothetical protein